MVMHLFQRPGATGPQRAEFSVAKDERIYAIGDVHGRHDLLIQLLLRIHQDAIQFTDERRVRIVFLGDYIDRGEDTKRVLDDLVHLADPPTDSIVLLRGNHEAAMLAFLEDPIAGSAWLDFGGIQTLASFGIPVPRSWSDHERLMRARDSLARAIKPYLRLFERMKDVHRSGAVVFSHAGIDPDLPLTQQPTSALHWGHQRFLVDQPLDGFKVVHGHFDAATPAVSSGRICVDTGAYYSGVLTAVRLDDREAFLSTAGSSQGNLA
jgi:serine/threonine protein phosphatase 1